MKDHLIRNIEIRDFKCFDNFKAEGFARVNLIGGKNNVGKTTFLEACDVSLAEEVKTLSTSLVGIKYRRGRLNHISEKKINFRSYLEKASKYFVSTNKNEVCFYVVDKDGVEEYVFLIGGKEHVVNVNDFSFQFKGKKNASFISNFGFNSSTIIKSYSSLQTNDKEEYLNGLLRKMDNRIESFKVIQDIPQCKVDSEYVELTDMGDGVRHLVSMVSSLYRAENGYLFIDEIESGIHYTMLNNIWEIILNVSKDLNVQVFATTHSKECIESFNRVQLKLKNIESSYFELAKEKETNEIFMSALPPSQLEYELSHEGKFRGE